MSTIFDYIPEDDTQEIMFLPHCLFPNNERDFLLLTITSAPSLHRPVSATCLHQEDNNNQKKIEPPKREDVSPLNIREADTRHITSHLIIGDNTSRSLHPLSSRRVSRCTVSSTLQSQFAFEPRDGNYCR